MAKSEGYILAARDRQAITSFSGASVNREAGRPIRRYYQTVWTARRSGDIVLIKTLLYTGVRVAELVSIRLGYVDLDACRIRITHGKGAKDRYVPFPATFKETLALHISAARDNGAAFLFESSWKKPYSTRGVRAILARYASKAGLAHNMPPHRLRHFLFTWLDPGHRRRPHPAPTPATPPAPPWRSTADSPSPMPSTPTTASSTSSPSEDHPGLRLVTRSLPTGLLEGRRGWAPSLESLGLGPCGGDRGPGRGAWCIRPSRNNGAKSTGTL